jgi:hypothetical protein
MRIELTKNHCPQCRRLLYLPRKSMPLRLLCHKFGVPLLAERMGFVRRMLKRLRRALCF